MKISMISNIEKVRAPSRLLVRERLVGWLRSSDSPRHKPSGLGKVHRGDGEPDGDSERGELAHPARRLEAVGDGRDRRHFAEDEPEGLHLAEIREADENEHEAHQRQHRSNGLDDVETAVLLVHFTLLQGAVFGGTLPQKSAGFWNSDDTTDIAYMRLKVKRNRKSPCFRAFSRFLYWIKKFSFPRMQNRQFIFEPKIQYVLTAERSEAAVSNLQFPKWCPRQDSNLEPMA